MEFSDTLSDNTVLTEIGNRIARNRLNKNLTQAMLAREAGVSLSTVTRIEAGQSSQLTNLVRLLRALGLIENLEALIPPSPPSPIQQLKLQGKTRKRAYRSKESEIDPDTSNNVGNTEPWSWDTPED